MEKVDNQLYRLIYNNNFNKIDNKIIVNDDKIKISLLKTKLNYNYNLIDIWDIRRKKRFKNNELKIEYEYYLNKIKLKKYNFELSKYFNNVKIKIIKRFLIIEINDYLNYFSKKNRISIIENIIISLKVLGIIPIEININNFNKTRYDIAFNIPHKIGFNYFYSLFEFNKYIIEYPIKYNLVEKKILLFLNTKKSKDKIKKINKKYNVLSNKLDKIKNPFRLIYFKKTGKHSIYFNGTKNSYFNFIFYDRAKNKNNLLKRLNITDYPFRFEIRIKGSFFKYPKLSEFFNGTAKQIFFNNFSLIQKKLNKIFSYQDKLQFLNNKFLNYDFFDFNNPDNFIFLEDFNQDFIEKYCISKNRFNALI